MCATCGCDQPGGTIITKVGDPQFKAVIQSDHVHFHHHSGNTEQEKRRIELEKDVLGKNNLAAQHNRFHFEEAGIIALNLVSSPGSGKTALLEATLSATKGQLHSYVIEGDQQTTQDADRIAATGCEVVQINTGKGCHLDADMVHRALHQLNPQPNSVVFIENVGNLVCPAMFDLGEKKRVAIISVTEGDDKPLKYPDMFESSHLCIINKIDLLPYVNFNVERAKQYARKVNPSIQFIELSATTGKGMNQWYEWLDKLVLGTRQHQVVSVFADEV